MYANIERFSREGRIIYVPDALIFWQIMAKQGDRTQYEDHAKQRSRPHYLEVRRFGLAVHPLDSSSMFPELVG
jgi:hypothetical protein